MEKNGNKPLDANDIHNNILSAKKSKSKASSKSASSKPMDINIKHTTPPKSVKKDITTPIRDINGITKPASIETKRTQDSDNYSPPSLEKPNEIPLDKTLHQHNKQKSPSANKPSNSPGVLLLQWLTYVLWGWLDLAAIWLSFVVIGHLVNPDNTAVVSMAQYVLATVIILLPIAVVVDAAYSRKEPKHKFGGASLIMIFHSVIFAIFGLGALVTLAFTVIHTLIAGESSDISNTTIISSIIVFIIYLATFLRTINPPNWRHTGTVFSIFMVLILGTLSVLNVTGPIQGQKIRLNDDQTTKQLTDLNDSIYQYTISHNSLPTSLDSVNYSPTTNNIVAKDLVTYSVEGQEDISDSVEPAGTTVQTNDTDDLRLNYKLCVDYNSNTAVNQYSHAQLRNRYHNGATFSASYNHPKGNVCYDMYIDV